jgi:zinc protease
VHSFTLANGLRVYLREDNRAPLVSVQLWYHVGSSYEPEGHTGLSHALEHLLFEGSSKLAPGQYSALMSRLGGDPNAFTYADATVFPLTCHATAWRLPWRRWPTSWPAPPSAKYLLPVNWQ